MTTNNTSALDEQFNMQCKVISLKYEYGIDSSLPQWAIISALTENEIMNLFPKQASRYAPFVALTPMMGKAMQKYTQNEDKHRKRKLRSIDIYGYDDELSPQFHGELCCVDEFFSEKKASYFICCMCYFSTYVDGWFYFTQRIHSRQGAAAA